MKKQIDNFVRAIERVLYCVAVMLQTFQKKDK